MGDRIELTDSVTYELDGEVAVVRLDDGKVNTIPPATVHALVEALDQHCLGLSQSRHYAGKLVGIL